MAYLFLTESVAEGSFRFGMVLTQTIKVIFMAEELVPGMSGSRENYRLFTGCGQVGRAHLN